ncbi:MAG: hypothetical protein ABSH20_15610 [Tepidisphaeraceae bacterium]
MSTEQPQSDPEFDPEGPEPEEMSDHDQPDLLPCPHCRKMITEEADRCHHCGEMVDEPPMSSPWSMVTIFVICLLIVLFAGGLVLTFLR